MGQSLGEAPGTADRCDRDSRCSLMHAMADESHSCLSCAVWEKPRPSTPPPAGQRHTPAGGKSGIVGK